jgi:hypothetical protein
LLRAALVVALGLAVGSGAFAQSSTTAPCCPIAQFFRGIAGEWVGVCRQSTDGQCAEDKYFHVSICEEGASCFAARFDYYRLDSSGALVRIGGSSVIVTVASDCSATGRITGNGEVLVDHKPKKQEHDLVESFTSTGDGQIQARGTGTLKVSGMPLGLGKLGRVREDQSSWVVSNDTLSIIQRLNIAFRALCFCKSYKIEACYTAVRGSDVSSQVRQQPADTPKSGE